MKRIKSRYQHIEKYSVFHWIHHGSQNAQALIDLQKANFRHVIQNRMHDTQVTLLFDKPPFIYVLYTNSNLWIYLKKINKYTICNNMMLIITSQKLQFNATIPHIYLQFSFPHNVNSLTVDVNFNSIYLKSWAFGFMNGKPQ